MYKRQAQLTAVEDDIVRLGAHLSRIGVQQRDILVHRRSERVVLGDQAVLLLAVLELRELSDPQQLVIVLFGKAETCLLYTSRCV